MHKREHWTEQNLLNLIENQVIESVSLDYKGCGALQKTESKKKEISKDVSAFANSAGGILIYGIKENGHIPTELDEGFDPHDITKEWLEQVINSRISRRIDGVIVHQVALSNPKSVRVLYVVEIPSSTQAPHMASGNRFYKRFNFESVPMEEYEVRDVSRRSVSPNLNVNLSVKDNQIKADSTIRAHGELYLLNDIVAPANFALVCYYIPKLLMPSITGIGGTDKENSIVYSEKSIDVESFKLEWRGGLRLPLMQGARYKITEFDFSFSENQSHPYIFWETISPIEGKKKGLISLQTEGGNIKAENLNGEWGFVKERVWDI